MSTPRERIPGWGADLPTANRPAYPKEKPSDVQHAYGNARPPQQVSDYPVQMSIEHAHVTPVFGTSCPPKGLSGTLRKTAFRFSEAELAHWMLLMLADRVDVYESLVTDLGRGKLPKPRERGWNVRIQDRNPEEAPRKPIYLAIGAIGVVAAAVLMARRLRED